MSKVFRNIIAVALVVFITTIVFAGISMRSAAVQGDKIYDVDSLPLNDSVEVVGVPVDDDPWLELEKIIQSYYRDKGRHCSGTITAIDDNGEVEKILEKMTFDYSFFKDRYHSVMGNLEMAQCNGVLVAVDHEHQQVNITNVSEAAGASFLPDLSVFRKLMEQREADLRVTKLGDKKILTIDNIADPSIQGYRIYYDPNSYEVTNMLIGMMRAFSIEEKEDALSPGEYCYYLDVVFEKNEIIGMEKSKFLPIERIVRKENGQWMLAPKYKDFQLTQPALP
ncbi:MAG: hypothetical protein ACO1NW_18530 [Chitinophagaceae bacterium]